MSEWKLFPMLAVATPLSLLLLLCLDATFDWFIFASAMVFSGFMVNTFYAIGTE